MCVFFKDKFINNKFAEDLNLSSKSLNNIKIFFNKVCNIFSKKKYTKNLKYAIITIVHNVEKDLDNYIQSVIYQKLDFSKNIFLILIDNGSSDNSSSIIKEYQKKYPKNIIYIQNTRIKISSARNLGLQYLRKNNIQAKWIAFIDTKSSLDKNYFYKINKELIYSKDIIEFILTSTNINNQCYTKKEFLKTKVDILLNSALFDIGILRKNYILFDDKLEYLSLIHI